MSHDVASFLVLCIRLDAYVCYVKQFQLIIVFSSQVVFEY